ncbi:ptges2, partial [Symbiodinium sp. KB8]
GVSVVIYGYRSCPFANKVYAFLDHHKVPYSVVEVNPLFKAEAKWQSYKRLPFAIINGRQVNDSDDIIDAVAALVRQQRDARTTKLPASAAAHGASAGEAEAADHLAGSAALFAAPGSGGVRDLTPEEAEREDRWRAWCRDTFVHTLSPNIYRTPREAWQAFEYIGQVSFSSLYGLPAQCIGAAVMYLVGKKVASKHGYDPKDVRGEMYSRMRVWTSEGLAGRPFCGGDSPNRADLAMFGVLRAIYGLE